MMNYEEIAKRRLTSVFNEKKAIEAVVVALPSKLSILEAVADQVRDERTVDLAIGIQLDKVGEIVGEPRQGKTDDAYRKAIRFRIFVNVSKGRPYDMIYATRFITEADNVQYMETYPATAIMFTDGYGANSDTPQAIQDVAPAALSDVPIIVSFGDDPFRLSNPNSATDNDSELAGVQLGVLVTMANKVLMTINGKRLRLLHNYTIWPSELKLSGVFQQ